MSPYSRLALVLMTLPMLQAKRSAVVAPAPAIGKEEERTGTGRFDNLDQEVLRTIMKEVPFCQRLACATSVCKAWRRLSDHKCLWMELIVRGCAETFRGYNLYNWTASGSEHLNHAVKCCSQGLLRLLDWLPDKSSVTQLDLSSTTVISPEVIKKES